MGSIYSITPVRLRWADRAGTILAGGAVGRVGPIDQYCRC